MLKPYSHFSDFYHFTLILVFFLLSFSISFAVTVNFIPAQSIFEKGLAGNEDANEKANQLFTELVEQQPDNPLYLAYLGATETILARDGWLPWKRLNNVDKGLDHIDKALAMLKADHDNQYERGSLVSIETRLVALITFLKVPDFANRFQDAKDLFAETIHQKAFTKAPAEVQQRIYLQGANIALKEKKNTDAIKYLKKGLSIQSKGPISKQIEQLLIDIEKARIHD